MSLSDRLSKAPATAAGLPCKIGTLLQGDLLPEKDRDMLRQVLETPLGAKGRLANTAIAAALREEGFDVGDAAVNKHRGGKCRCYGSSPKYGVTA